MSLIHEVREHCRWLEALDNAASDLWVWLPYSRTEDDTPDPIDVMRDAVDEIARLRQLVPAAAALRTEAERG